MPSRRDPLPRLRKICLALPEAREQIAWGEPTSRVRKKLIAMYANADNHHGRGRSAVWIKGRAVNHVGLPAAFEGERGRLRARLRVDRRAFASSWRILSAQKIASLPPRRSAGPSVAS